MNIKKVNQVIDICCSSFNMDRQILKSKVRKLDNIKAKEAIIWFLNKSNLNLHPVQIGALLHSSRSNMLHSLKKVAGYLEIGDKEYKETYSHLQDKIDMILNEDNNDYSI